MRVMTKYEFRRALANLDMTQAASAKFLGVSIRTAHGWANGGDIPIAIQRLLRTLINKRIDLKDTETPIPM
jgi:predicted site-specific integrase-resolvase